MKRSRGGRAGLLALVMLALSAPGANAVVVHLSNGRVASVYLHAGLSAAAYERQTGAAPLAQAGRTGLASADPNGLSWQGGPVLHATSPYLVFWDPRSAISSQSRQVLTQYLNDAGQDRGNPIDVYAYRVLQQYTDSNGAAAQGQTFSPGTQVLNDSQAYPSEDRSTCTEPSGISACITDAQIQAELSRLISADHLPSGTGANAPIYFVVTPKNVNVCINGGGGCATQAFCAYHSSYTLTGSTQVVYASIPFTQGALCQAAGLSTVQEPNGDVADVIADNLSHENAEAITDPLVGTAWVTSNGYEVGDQCEMTGPNNPNNELNSANGPSSMDAYLPTLGGSESLGTLYDQRINGDHYFTQTLWSNSADNCAATAEISPSFTSPATVLPGTSVSFDPTASSSTDGYTSTIWNWGDGTRDTVAAGAPTAISHEFSSPGSYTVTLTLIDAGGNTADASHTVLVDSPPTPAFSASDSVAEAGSSVAFTGAASNDPNPGASIAGYSWSFGDGSPGAAGVAPSHAYTSPGTYTVTLTVAGSDALTAAVSRAITVVAVPLAVPSLSTPQPVTGSPVAFNGGSSSGGISAYAWNFGDGATGSGAAPRHTYAKPGTYTTSLTVTDSAGFTSARSLTVIVASPGRVKRWSVKLVKGTYYLVVTVTRAGTVRVGSARATLKAPGQARFRLTPSGAERERLARHQTASLKVKIVYVPVLGPRVSKTTTVRLTG